MSAGKWRLLNQDEIVQHGDQMCVGVGWAPVRDEDLGALVAFSDEWAVRRPFTPAEERAEELLKALKATEGILSMYIPPTIWGRPEPHFESVRAARATIAKAEGRRP